MTANDQARRVEQLEVEARREDMRPVLEALAAEHDLDADDILREAWRIHDATSGMSREQQKAWHAQDLAGSTSLTEDEALAEVRTWIAW